MVHYVHAIFPRYRSLWLSILFVYYYDLRVTENFHRPEKKKKKKGLPALFPRFYYYYYNIFFFFHSFIFVLLLFHMQSRREINSEERIKYPRMNFLLSFFFFSNKIFHIVKKLKKFSHLSEFFLFKNLQTNIFDFFFFKSYM